MSGIDVTKLSDAELAALLQGGGQVQPTNAATGQALSPEQAAGIQQYAAAGGYDPHAQPGSARQPLAQTNPQDIPGQGQFFFDPHGKVQHVPTSNLGQFLDGATRSVARGVPVVGAWADEADAATNAIAAPIVEPVWRTLQRAGLPMGYDERYRLDNIHDLGQRYQAALNLQHISDSSFDQQHGHVSTAAKAAGLVLGAIEGGGVMGAGSAALSAEAGLVPRMAVGALEGGVLGGVQGAGDANGNLSDRLHGAENGAMMGAAAGGALPVATRALGAAWDATGAKAASALRGRLSLQPPPQPLTPTQALARVVGAQDTTASDAAASAAAGVRPLDQLDLADVLATRSRTPAVDVSPRDMGQATNLIARALARQGMSATDAIARADAVGPAGVLADTGDPVRSLLRTATDTPSGASDVARAVLDARQNGVLEGGNFVVRPSSTRILDAAENGLGLSGQQYHSAFDALHEQQQAAAKPLYDAVRDLGPVDSPTLQALQTRPSLQQAMVRAYRIAKEQGRDPEALGLVNVERPGAWDSEAPPTADDIGTVTLRAPARAPSRGRSLLKFIGDNGGISDATDELEAMDGHLWHVGKAYQKPLSGTGGTLEDWSQRAFENGYFPHMTARPADGQFLDAIRGELRGKPLYARDIAQELTDRMAARDAADELAYRGGSADHVPSPDDYTGRPEPVDEPAWEGQPTAETWDYVKRGLDDVLETYRDKTSGRLVLDGEGRNINNTLKDLRGELVRLNPVYGEALKAYSGPAAAKDALEAGRAALREDAPDLAKRFADMNPGEQQMYRLGALQSLKDKLGNADVTYDAARGAGLLKPNQLERFKEIFPDEDAFGGFVDRLQNERTMFQTRAATTGNSTTPKQLAQMADAHANAAPPHLLLSAASGHAWPSVLAAVLHAGGPRKLTGGGAEAIASILTQQDRPTLSRFATNIDGAQARSRLIDAVRDTLSTVGKVQAPHVGQPAQ